MQARRIRVEGGGCVGCHTEDEGQDAVPYAGGRALKTPFGTFYGPNITPHPEAGIGALERSRLRARDARRPPSRRRELFPAFPIRRSPRISDARPARPVGLPALAAGERDAEPGRTSSASSTAGAFSSRSGSGSSSPRARWSPDAAKRAVLNRGAYLVAGARPLRRVPHAAQLPRRTEARAASSPAPSWAETARAEHHADAAEEVERRAS